jgi:ribonuclease P protein component
VDNCGNYPFDKSRKLLDAKAYKAVFDDAQLKVSSQQALFLARENSFTYPRLGLVIAKKNVRLATHRNRIKRIIRESFRLQHQPLKGIDTVVLARRGLDQLDNAALRKIFDQLWQQLDKKADKKNRQKQSKTKSL